MGVRGFRGLGFRDFGVWGFRINGLFGFRVFWVWEEGLGLWSEVQGTLFRATDRRDAAMYIRSLLRGFWGLIHSIENPKTLEGMLLVIISAPML